MPYSASLHARDDVAPAFASGLSLSLPEEAQLYARTPDIVPANFPRELGRAHRHNERVWSVLRVLEGECDLLAGSARPHQRSGVERLLRRDQAGLRPLSRVRRSGAVLPRIPYRRPAQAASELRTNVRDGEELWPMTLPFSSPAYAVTRRPEDPCRASQRRFRRSPGPSCTGRALCRKPNRVGSFRKRIRNLHHSARMPDNRVAEAAIGFFLNGGTIA